MASSISSIKFNQSLQNIPSELEIPTGSNQYAYVITSVYNSQSDGKETQTKILLISETKITQKASTFIYKFQAIEVADSRYLNTICFQSESVYNPRTIITRDYNDSLTHRIVAMRLFDRPEEISRRICNELEKAVPVRALHRIILEYVENFFDLRPEDFAISYESDTETYLEADSADENSDSETSSRTELD